MRPVYPAFAIRPVTRSVRPASVSSSSWAVSVRARAPASERCVPNERGGRAGCTGVRSRFCARAWTRRPEPVPRISTSSASPSCASWPTVLRFAACSLCAVFGPTPQSCSTRSGCRNERSSLGATTSSPSGLAARLAIFATSFVRAMPTVIGRLVSARTSARSRSPIARASPFVRARTLMSRNASSIPIGSTTAAVRSKTANTALLAAT